MAEIDLTPFEGHTPGPWWTASTGSYKVSAIASTGIYADTMPRDDVGPDSRLIAAAPTLLADVKRQAAEIERLRAALCSIDRQLGHDDADDALRDEITAALEQQK